MARKGLVMGNSNSSYHAEEFRRIFVREFTYLQGFLRNTHRYGGKTALTCPIRSLSWTYAEIDQAANRRADALRRDGVGKGDVVVDQLLNCEEFVVFILAPPEA